MHREGREQRLFEGRSGPQLPGVPVVVWSGSTGTLREWRSASSGAHHSWDQ